MHKKILLVLAHDKGTRFFQKAIFELKHALDFPPVSVDTTTMYPNKESLQKCVLKIQSLPEYSEVIFFIHGGNGYITASSVGARHMASGGTLSISQDLCSGKDFIVVACDSNTKTIGSFKRNGALSAVGFGAIDFACKEFYTQEVSRKNGKRPTRERFSKFIFRRILVSTIIYIERHNKPYRQFLSVFRFFCNYYMDELLLNSTIDKQSVSLSWNKKLIISRFLQKIKEDIDIK